MNKNILALMTLVLLSLFVVANCSNLRQQKSEGKYKELPTATIISYSNYNIGKGRDQEWVSLFVKMDEIIKSINLVRLNDERLNKEDIELRFWLGPGLGMARIIRLKKSRGIWQGWEIEADRVEKGRYVMRDLPLPRLGWEGVWQELVELGILSLVECKNNPAYPDAGSYTLEIVVKGKYRSFVYFAPEINKCPDAKKMIRFDEILFSKEGK